MSSCRANFQILKDLPGKPLLILDMGPWDRYPTITNDAEALVEALREAGYLPDGRKLIYYDSEGELGEILVKNGAFAGFAPFTKEGS